MVGYGGRCYKPPYLDHVQARVQSRVAVLISMSDLRIATLLVALRTAFRQIVNSIFSSLETGTLTGDEDRPLSSSGFSHTKLFEISRKTKTAKK